MQTSTPYYPHRHRGYRAIPGSSGILTPEFGKSSGSIILPEDEENELSDQFARAGQGIMIPRGRSMVGYGQKSLFPTTTLSLSGYQNAVAANEEAASTSEESHSTTTRFIAEGGTISASEQDFRARLLAYIKKSIDEMFQSMGQLSYEDAQQKRRTEGARVVSFEGKGDILMQEVRRMSLKHD